MTSTVTDKKTLLLKTGQSIFATHGFTNVGLTELLKQAGVPKGSFYYYFASKEDYGVAVISYYMNEYTKSIIKTFDQPNLSGKERLLAYWNTWQVTQSANDYQGRCLIIKLSSEVSDFSEAMRNEFSTGTERILSLIAQTIEKGQQDGSISTLLDPTFSAQKMYQQWLGASLLTKIQKNATPFQVALQYTKDLLNT